MTKPVQFTFTPEQMARFLAWRARVEAETGTPLEGVVFSCLVTHQGALQLIVRPSTEQDFKLPNVPRIDGTYDTFAPHEEVLAAYDDVGFAATTILWRDVGIRLWLCEGTMLARGETPRCYVECLGEPHRPFVPFRIGGAGPRSALPGMIVTRAVVMPSHHTDGRRIDVSFNDVQRTLIVQDSHRTDGRRMDVSDEGHGGRRSLSPRARVVDRCHRDAHRSGLVSWGPCLWLCVHGTRRSQRADDHCLPRRRDACKPTR